MDIITVPHPSLREKAVAVENFGDEHLQFMQDLTQTLKKTDNPKGVGLAAPQVDTLWRMFATQLDDLNTVFINPVIVKHSSSTTFSEEENDGEPYLEGCLSIPNLIGPIPRWEWIEVEYQEYDFSQDALVEQSKRFDSFASRLIQHEIDHLDGILFIDHSLEKGLTVYQGTREGEYEPVERSFLQML